MKAVIMRGGTRRGEREKGGQGGKEGGGTRKKENCKTFSGLLMEWQPQDGAVHGTKNIMANWRCCNCSGKT